MTTSNYELGDVHDDQRRAARVRIRVGKVRLRQTGAKSIPVVIDDLSLTGCRVEWPHHAQVGNRLWVKIGHLQPMSATVAWTKGFRVGCQFDTPLHPAVFETLVGNRA